MAGNYKIVAFGDSTTALNENFPVYSELLQRLFDEYTNFDFVNAGVKSNTTSDAMKRFEKDVLNLNPRLVIIQFGINDSAIDVWKDKNIRDPRTSITDFDKNMRDFIKRCRAYGTDVLLMTPNSLFWTDELKKLYGQEPYNVNDPDGFNFQLESYAQKVRDIAASENLECLDIFNIFKKDIHSLLLDGIHPNANAHERLAELIRPKLIKILGITLSTEK
jgi:lysophospholipase L1-like esterase